MNKKLQELIAKRARAWEAAKDFLDAHRDESGILSAEDSTTYDRMEKEITDLTNEIGRTQRLIDMEAEMSRPQNAPLTGRPLGGRDQEQKTGRASAQYASDMLDAMRTNFRKVSDVLEEGADANGGYLVPDEWDARLIQKLESENVLRALGTKIVTSGEHKINIVATTPAASWIAEGGPLTFGQETFAQKILDAHKLHVAIKVTEELLYDNAFDLENHIIEQFAKAIANAEENAFLNGDGSGKPTGLLHATLGGDRVTPLAGATIKSDDVLDLIYALKRPYRKNASFIMNDSTLAHLRKLQDNNKAYIWQPSYQAGEPDRLCGYAVNTSAYCPTMAAGNAFMAFGDFSYYNIGDRGVRSLQQLRELFAGNGMIGYVMKERVDGILVLQEAVKVLSVAGS